MSCCCERTACPCPICPENRLQPAICGCCPGRSTGTCNNPSPSCTIPSCPGGGAGVTNVRACNRRREKRWPQCNFLKPCIDTRIYRDGESMTVSYAGHIPGEMYVYGRNLPTATTFAKRRLCRYTPYEYVDPSGCCCCSCCC